MVAELSKKVKEKAQGGFQGGAWVQAVPLQCPHGAGSYPPCNMCVKAF